MFQTRDEITARRKIRGLHPAPTECDACGGNRTGHRLDVTETRAECRLCLHERLQGPGPELAPDLGWIGRQGYDTDAEYEYGFLSHHRPAAR